MSLLDEAFHPTHIVVFLKMFRCNIVTFKVGQSAKLAMPVGKIMQSTHFCSADAFKQQTWMIQKFLLSLNNLSFDLSHFHSHNLTLNFQNIHFYKTVMFCAVSLCLLRKHVKPATSLNASLRLLGDIMILSQLEEMHEDMMFIAL